MAYLLLVLGGPVLVQAQVGTAFTYQGQLKQDGQPANGPHDFEFSLWDAAAGGSQVGPTVSLDDVPVADGLFTVQLDFGASPYATNEARWLQIVVNGTPLAPRQPLTPTAFSLATRGINVAENGYVSVQHASPDHRFHVAGGSSVEEVNNDIAFLTFETSGQGHRDYRVGVTAAAPPDGYPSSAFFIADVSGNPTEESATIRSLPVVIRGSLVGIGTATPTARLAVQQETDTNLSGAIITNSAVNRSLHLWVDASSRGRIDVGTAADQPLLLNAGGTGYLGIGTTNPTAKLHIAGTPGVDGIRFPDGTLQTTAATGGGGGGGIGGIREYTASGAFVVPTGVSRILVEMWGGGGGASPSGCGWGGSGAYVRTTLAVNPGESLTVTLGAGGGVGQAGGFSRISRGAIALATAGGGQPGTDPCNDGAGGMASGPVGILRNGNSYAETGGLFEAVEPPFWGRSDLVGGIPMGSGAANDVGANGYVVIQW